MTPDESIKRREEILAALQPFLEEIRKNYAKVNSQTKPTITGPAAQETTSQQPSSQQIAKPPTGIPIAQSLGNAPQAAPPIAQHVPQATPIAAPFATPVATPFATPIAGPAPSTASATSLAGGSNQPIAGPAQSLAGTAPTFGAGAPPSAGAQPQIAGHGMAGPMGLASQSGNLLSGGAGTGSGQQDLLSAITELIEVIKDLTEKMDSQDKRQEAHTPNTHKSGTGSKAQSGGKDVISQAASGAPGIEWANQMERWFASRFGRGNFGG